MSTERNKAVVQRLNIEIWNQKNTNAVDEIFAPNVVIYRSGRPVIQRSESLKRWMSNDAHTIWGNWQTTIDEIVAEGDLVVTRKTIRATHMGEWQGIAPTGKPVTITNITIHRIVDGRIAEIEAEEDWLEVMQQIKPTGE